MRDILFGQQFLVIPIGAQPGTPYTIIGNDIPAALHTFYEAQGMTLQSAILAYTSAGFYYYDLNLYFGDDVVHARGSVDPVGNVSETEIFSSTPTDIPYRLEVGPTGQIRYGQFGAPRTLIGCNVRSPSGTTGASTGTETVALWDTDGQPTFTFPDGRLFKIECQGMVEDTAAGISVSAVRVRKGTTTGGTELAKTQVNTVDTAAVQANGFSIMGYIKNDSGSTVFTSLTATNQMLEGGGTTRFRTGTNNPLLISVTDYAVLSEHPALDASAIQI